MCACCFFIQPTHAQEAWAKMKGLEPPGLNPDWRKSSKLNPEHICLQDGLVHRCLIRDGMVGTVNRYLSSNVCAVVQEGQKGVWCLSLIAKHKKSPHNSEKRYSHNTTSRK